MFKYLWLLPGFLFVAGWNAVGHWHGGIGTGLLGLIIVAVVWIVRRYKRQPRD